jgi:hypothetical protein
MTYYLLEKIIDFIVNRSKKLFYLIVLQISVQSRNNFFIETAAQIIYNPAKQAEIVARKQQKAAIKKDRERKDKKLSVDRVNDKDTKEVINCSTLHVKENVEPDDIEDTRPYPINPAEEKLKEFLALCDLELKIMEQKQTAPDSDDNVFSDMTHDPIDPEVKMEILANTWRYMN